MVSWGEEEESSATMSSLGTGANTTYDSDYCGLDDGNPPVHCTCQTAAEKFVGFEGVCTGRRFYACAGHFGDTCDFIQWVDDPWPEQCQKAILKIWEMYIVTKDGRTHDAINYMEKKFDFEDEITQLKQDLSNAQEGLKKVVEEKKVTEALKAKVEQYLVDARAELEEKKKLDASTCNMHKCLRLKAEKDMDKAEKDRDNAENERDKLKAEKKKLEYMIADLLKQKEGTRAKLKQICDEF